MMFGPLMLGPPDYDPFADGCTTLDVVMPPMLQGLYIDTSNITQAVQTVRETQNLLDELQIVGIHVTESKLPGDQRTTVQDIQAGALEIAKLLRRRRDEDEPIVLETTARKISSPVEDQKKLS